MNKEHTFEMMRHSKKDSEGNISPEGREMAEKDAQETFERIEAMPNGSVICMIPSNVGRAVETKEIIEKTIEELMTNDEHKDDYIIVNLGEDDTLEIAKNNPNKKLLLKHELFSVDIGIPEVDGENKTQDTFIKYLKQFGWDEDAVGKLWACKNEELNDLSKEMEEKNEGGGKDLNPSEFFVTPELITITQLQWLKDVKDVAAKFFPDRPVLATGVTHNIQTDYAMMRLLGMPISYESIKKLGGRLSDFLEKGSITIDGENITVKFRDQEVSFNDRSIESIINNLEQEGKEREKKWQELKNDNE